MNKGVLIGLLLVIGGVVIGAIYALIKGFDEIMQAFNYTTGLIGGLIILGILVIFASVIIDRYHEHKEIQEKIPKEDLKP